MTKLTEFLKSIGNMLMSTSSDQAWLFDSTIYCGEGGLAPDKIAPWCHGMLIQTGIGDWISPLLQEQISVANSLNLPRSFWHIPKPGYGSMSSQAKLVLAQPNVKGYMVWGDFEPAEAGNYDTMVSADEAHDFLLALDDENGRASGGYSNPDILLNRYRMPAWVYDYDWWIAQYPNSTWDFFEEFLQYYTWKYPSYFRDNPEFCQRIKFQQWTRWGKAKHYYSVDRLPNGGDGLNGGDLDIAFLTAGELVDWWKSDETDPDPDPDPEDPGLAEKVAELDERLTEVEGAVYSLSESVEALANQVAALEQQAHDHDEDAPDPDPEKDFILVQITDQHPPYYYKGTDASCPDPNKGKPDMLRREGLDPFTVGQPWKVNAQLALSCHDNPATPRITGADGRKYYRIVTDGDYRGRFILADKAQKVEDE